MREKIGTAVLELTTETGAAFSDLDQLEKRAGGLDKSWLQTGMTMQKFGQQMINVGSAVTTLSLPLAAVGLGAAKAAIDFESSFAGVRKTVNATEDEFQALSGEFREMAKTIPVNVNELNRLGEAAGALGIPKGEISDFARVMALLGVTTNVTSDQAAESIAKIQNIFGAAGKDTERFASTLVALGNDGASTESQILELANRIASAGNAVHLTQGQVLGFASAIANVGIEAEAGGTAMSKVLIDISKAVSHGGSDLANFARVAGLSSEAFAKAFKTDAAEATRLFIQGLGHIQKSGGDLNTTIEDLGFTEVRQSNLLRSLALSGDNVTNALKLQATAWSANTALSIEAGKRFETLQSQLQLLWNRIQDVAITLGNALTPAIKLTVSGVTTLIPMIEGMVRAFTSLPSAVQLGIVGLGGLVIASGPLIYVTGTLITNFGVISKAMPAISAATTTLGAGFGTLGQVATGLSLGLVLVAKASAVIAAAWVGWQIGRVIGEWSGLTDLIGHATAVLGDFIGLLPKGAGEQYLAMRAAEKAAEAAKKHALALRDTGAAAMEFIGPIQDVNFETQAFVQKTADAKKASEEFAKSLRAIGGADALAGAREVVKQLNAIGGPLNVLPSKLAEMAARLREGAEAAALKGHAQLANNYHLLADTLNPVIQFQQRYNVTLGDYATNAKKSSDFTQELWEQIHRLAGEVQTIGPLLKSSMDLSKLFVGFKGAVTQNLPDSQQWTQAWSQMKTGLVSNLASIPGTLAKAFEGGGDIWGAVKSIGTQIGSGIGGAIGFGIGGPAGQQIGQAIGSLVGPALEGFKRLFGIGINEEVKKANVEIDKLRNGLLDTYGPLDQLEKKANMVGLSFEQNWGHQGQAGLAAMNALIAEFEGRMKAVSEASNNAVSAFAAVATSMTGPWIALGDRIKTTRQEAVDAAAEVRKLEDDEKTSAEQLVAARSKVEEIQRRLIGLLSDQTITAGNARQALADLGVQAIGTFAAALASGKSYTEAIAAVAPGLQPLRDAYKALDLEVEDVGLKQLLLATNVATTNPQLLAAVGAHAMSMQSLAQLGLLNVDTFGAMERTGTQLYTRLQSELAGTEDGTRLALLPMQDFLHQAEIQATALGIPLDANTQRLIDQSKELNLWKETGATAQDRVIAGMEKLIERVDHLLSQMLGVSGAIVGLPARRDVEINITTNEHIFRTVTDLAEGLPVIPEAEGGMGRVTKPTLFYSAGNEDFAFSGEGSRFGAGAQKENNSQSSDRSLLNAIDRQTESLGAMFRSAVLQLGNS